MDFGQTADTCRGCYEYFKRSMGWDEGKMNKLARLYKQFKFELWSNVAKELEISPEAVEDMHWLLGQHGMTS
ncbi:hypothetical protein BDV06DRAFT_206719 [Aspergillus oleicola]